MAKDDEIFDLDNLDKANSKISVLITRLNEADAELVNLSKNALLASKNLASINTPGGLGKSQGDNAKTLAELEKLKQKYTELEKRIIKLNEARKKSNDLSFQ
jgi:predicted  nucleic acid-binding Zn-ribbon protein